MKFGNGIFGEVPESDTYTLFTEMDMVNELPPTCLIDGLVPENAVVLFNGQKGQYKSFLGLDMALTMSHGLGSFHGHACQRGGVIYIAGEGAGGLGLRINAWRQYHKLDQQKLSPFWLIRQPFGILKDEDVDRLIRTVQYLEGEHDCQFKMLFVDTVSRALQGAKEDEEAWGRVIGNLEKIKEEIGHGMSSVAICHQGKDADRGTRGSSVADCNADAILTATSNKKDTPDVCLLKVEKLKDLEDGQTYTFVACKQRWNRPDVGWQDSIVFLTEDEETEMQRTVRMADRGERLKNSAKASEKASKQAEKDRQQQEREDAFMRDVASIPDGEYTAYALCRAMSIPTGDNKKKFSKVFPLNEAKAILTEGGMRTVLHVEVPGDGDIYRVYPTR